MRQFSYVLLVILAFASCSKPGTGGRSRINVFVMRDTEKSLIQDMQVYIKYGATTSPGTEAGDYNDSEITNHHGKCSFKGLRRGNYFFYTEGFDSLYQDSVSGEGFLEIDNKSGERNLVIYTLPIQ